MDAVFLTMGGILIPFGFYLKIEQSQLDDVGTVAVIVGLVAWLLAYYTVRRREKKERLERQEELRSRREEAQVNTKLLENIYQELRKLNQGNEHSGTTKQ
ncbi:MAG: hypothetical protein Q8N90_03570 [bacterium]|nr:hypothetical protein [bacterium]